MKKITRVLSDTRVLGYLPGTRVTGIETGTRVPVPSTSTSHGPVSVCLSVCVCVCLSQVGVLLKRLNTGSHKQNHTIAQGL